MSTSIQNEYVPETVSPPGATIQDLLNERGMTRGELAEQMSRTRDFVDRLIRGTASLSQEVARELEHVLNVPARFWTRREKLHQASSSSDAT
jgi:plasmid maintenance system antidote protein VapI